MPTTTRHQLLTAAVAIGLLVPSVAVPSDILCEEAMPEDCLTIWQAHALGYVEVTSSAYSGVKVTLANSGEFDLCLEDQALYTSDGSQSFFLDDDITDAAWEIGDGEDLDTYYGNWTTANGYYYPYYGLPAWWCVEYGQYAAAGATYDYFGEQIPDALAYYISTDTDVDGDGRTDKDDWAGTFGVQANYNIWNYQNSFGILTAGKLAEPYACAVLVTLTSRNIGYDTASGTLTDTIPAGWTASEYSTTPDTTTYNADGSTTVTWSLTVTGTYGGIVLDVEQITYVLDRDIPADLPYLELPEADVHFDGGDGFLTNYSLPAAVYNLDLDCDGDVACTEEEICDGVDNDLDGDIDEGFDADGDGFADCMEECVVEERFCSLEDGLNLLADGTPAVLTYDGNSRWTAAISGAEWIWDEYYETNPEGDEVQSIFRDFTLQHGYYDLDATLEIGADNSYEVWLNAASVASDATEYNYFAPTDVWDLTAALTTGDNSLEFEVWNWAQPGGSAYSNPGGLLYCVDVAYSYEMDAEICNGVDDDCDGLVDDDDPDVTGQGTWYADADGDGFGDPATAVVSCDAPDGYVADGTDCDDNDPAINPGASEICNGVDDDCDGLVDDEDTDTVGQSTWYLDADGDAYGDPGDSVTSCEAPTGYVTDATDCDDDDAGVNPAAVEICDAIDNDCDGLIDEGLDSDGDGLADCFDSEECDGLDNDGDGLVDDDDPDVTGQSTWYTDGDGDGYGASAVIACDQPAGTVADDSDCDDGDAAVNPGAAELCNGIDDDCDGLVDDADGDVADQGTWYTDADGDGYGDAGSPVTSCEQPSGTVEDATDCDDGDADMNHDDLDGDGWSSCDGDCDEDDASINPGAAEACNGIDDDCDGEIDEDFDGDGDGYTTCGYTAECDVLIDLFHGEDTWSDPYDYTTSHAWGYAVDDLLAAGYGWEANSSEALNPELMDDYHAMVIAEPVSSFSEDEVDAVLDYVYDGGGVLLITDFNEPYINAISEELGVSFHGYSDLIGWTAIDAWDSSHAISDGIDSVFWAYGSTMSVTDASVTVLATYSGTPVYAYLEYGDGRVVFSADNEVFAAYGYFRISDPDPSAERDNVTLWAQTMDWLIDCEGSTEPDCDDTDYDVNPGAEEICNGIDDDCDGYVDEGFDTDGDGYTTCEGDCDADDWAINPGATELCDGVDNDCDGLVDDDDDSVADQGTWYSDGDGDGFGASAVTACEQPSGTVDDSTDCDDTDLAVNPDATEVCNGIDDDCDGLVDDADDSVADQGTWYTDGDGDGYGSGAVVACEQPTGSVDDSTDCDDGDAAINPGAAELCNGYDDDCDGLVDDADDSVSGQGTWYSDGDGDGFGSGAVTACEQPSGSVSDDTDCDDGDAAINPGAQEVCNGYDDDCDGLVDDADDSVSGQGTWYSDSDGDGYGDAGAPVTVCEQPSDAVEDDTDCDDDDMTVYPGAVELCDDLDNDCDGWVDEGDACIDDCDELVPDECLTVWQAHARGFLDISSSSSAVVTMTNTGPYDICIDEQVLYTSDDTQTFFVDEEVTLAATELAPGDSFSVYYGSWTTDNGYYSPYLGGDAWWCVENGQYATGGAGFDWYGEQIPSTLGYFVATVTDEDGDGVDDDVDWAGTYGVQANYNIWSWQSGHGVLTAGKTADASGGEVWVTLVSRNIGYDDASGTLNETIPAGWTVTSWTVEPDTQVDNADGTLSVSWDIEVLGTAGGLTLDMVDLSYAMERDCGSDLPYLELEAAWVDYFDGDADVSSESLPAAVYNIDVDDDGILTCSEEEVCDGVDNDLDCEIDEGFDADADGFADCMEECVIEERFCSAEDGLNLLDDGTPAVLTYDGNARWTVSVSGAEWIWDEYYETNPEGDEVHSIFRGFGIQAGAWDLDASVELGADNSYEVWLNGTSVGSDSTEYNYFAPSDIYDLTGALAEGDNDLEFEVWNWAQPGGSAYSNPGGLLYCVDVAYSYEMDPEICDGLDNDCDGLVDDDDPDISGQGVWYADADGDGFGDAADTVVSCVAPSGYVADDTDCDDADAAINPGASELCNGVDDDCDGLVDDDDSDVVGQSTWYADADTDGYGDADSTLDACVLPDGYTSDASDCDDADAAVNPAATELCNGIDDDCDGLVDDADDSVADRSTWYADLDGDGYGDAGNTVDACEQPSGYGTDTSDCDDGDATINPAATEICDGIDNDCDADVDEGMDSDADGVADCFDTEECDGIDNDGDGLVDDDDADVVGQSTWYADADGDGYGDTGSTVTACEAPSGYVGYAEDSDCDDADAAVNPGAVEVCNEVDDDCDASVDEDQDGVALDCGEDDCPELEPDECLTLWQAHARGWLWVETGDDASVNLTNVGVYPVCIDEHGLHTSESTPSMFVDPDLVGSIELAPAETRTLYYGSWTTDNDTYLPYLGEDPWWCLINHTPTRPGLVYEWYGEEVPGVLSSFIATGWDIDGDGVDDLDDWAAAWGVQAQYSVWDYQAANPVLTAGKLAEVDGGEILVTVSARNVGYLDGIGELTDTIPAGWTATFDVAPDAELDNGDGSLSVTWLVDMVGTGGAAVIDADTFTYTLVRDCGSDAPYTELPEASVVYDDSVGEQTSWSMPAAAYNLDVHGDGVVDCAEEETCDGLDNDLDCEVDEGFDVDADGWTSCGGDCDDGEAAVNPDATEACNGIDDDCDGLVDEGMDSDTDGIADCFDTEECDGVDNDGDGLVDDDDPDIIGQSTWYADADTDGFGDAGTTADACTQPSGYTDDASDCDDADAAVFPGATELCNDIDDDCDGLIDDADADVADQSTWYADADADGYGDASDSAVSCDQPDGYVPDATDCDDADGAVNPGAAEVCNGIDDDCDSTVDEGFDSDVDGIADCFDTEECDGVDNDGDGLVDDADDSVIGQLTWYADADADSYGDPSVTTLACDQPSGWTDDATDCDDSDAAVNPAGAEVCNGYDDDCDGLVDDDDSPVGGVSTWYADSDSDGYGDPRVTTAACEQPDGFISDGTDCDDGDAAVNPAGIEVCNGIDDDCDGLIDDDDSTVSGTSTWYADADADGYGDPRATTQACEQPSGWTDDATDCDDSDAAVNPAAAEVCNDIDDDCDGLIDDDDSVSGTSTWYLDADADGYGDPRTTTQACEQPSGWTDDATDCDDSDAAVNPDALEVCNGVDDDCDGSADEDDVCGDDDCEDVVPDTCLTLWQAHARGWLSLGSGGSGEAVDFVNSGTYDVCLDERALYASVDTQAFFLDAGITDLPEQLATGESYTAYYGSWTTDNGSYTPYLDEGAWWCVDNGNPAIAGGSYVYYGEEVPEALATWVDTLTDVDSDGEDDLVDWAGSYGVQAQYNIWDWQLDQPVLTAGKLAEEILGDVVVTLTSRNLGDLSGEGWLVDTVPAGWSVVSTELTPDQTVPNADGTTTLGWFLELDAFGSSGDTAQLAYTIARDASADVAYLELEPAWITYASECPCSSSSVVILWPPDCGGEISSSLPAAVYNIDVDQDGVQDCPEEEICDGLDNDLNGLVDDGLADADADGVCDDMDVEECDGVDNDGDTEVDEGCPGTISGVVFFDEDEDGSQGYCEPGLADVVVWADGPDCDGDGIEDSYETTTDSDGGYIFTDLCAGDWVVSFEEHPFDRLTTENPVELTLGWAGDETVDFGITRCFHVVGTCWWLGHPAAVEAALPFEVAGTSYETFDQVRAVLRGTPSCWSAQLHQLLVLAKLNDSRFGIGVHPWMDFDGDGVCETIGDLIAMAEAALETGDYTSFRNWCIALHGII